MCFPTEGGVKKVREDQVAVRECYMALFKGDLTPKETMTIDNLEVQDERTQVVEKLGGEIKNIILDSTTPN